jgi:hypothetical protein
VGSDCSTQSSSCCKNKTSHMSDIENPNPGIASSEAENGMIPSVEITTSTSLHVPDMTEQESAEATVERQRLQSMFMEFLSNSFSIGDEDDSDSEDGGDDDNNPLPSRCTLCCACFRETLHRLLNIIAYPFMVLFTIVSLVMIATFCILPTLFCLTFGICTYYCFMDDPMSLHMLLRYMFSPDNAAEAAFANGNGYPLAQNRSLIQSKLIVRRLIMVTNSSDGNVENGNKNINKKYPRRHPSSILIWTESKCLQFSAPLVFDEESNVDENLEKKRKKKKKHNGRRRRDEDVSPSSGDDDGEGEGGGGDNSVIFYIPHEQRSQLQNRSNPTIQDGMPENFGNYGEVEMIAEISTRDGTEAPIAQDETEEEIAVEGDLENVPIPEGHDEYVVGEKEEEGIDDGRQASESTGHLSAGAESNDEREETDVSDVLVCQDCDDTFHEILHISHDSVNLPRPGEADYFGIESEIRDRNTACDICLLEYEIGDKVAWSPNLSCSHTYHNDCVLDW